jgi:hypothetical protein
MSGEVFQGCSGGKNMSAAAKLIASEALLIPKIRI